MDDEEDLCEILRFNLEAEGFEVETALSAEAALQLLDEGHAFSLMLLDVMLGGMSGFAMAQTLRERGDVTPVVFLTAMDGHDAQLEGFEVGGDDYITKPFAFDTVLARIRAVLRRSGGARQQDRPIGVQPEHGELTRREHLIWQLLQAHRGRYLTRQEILSAVWPGDTVVGERSVDVHIARLRKKLGSEGSRIVNKTGFGYGLV